MNILLISGIYPPDLGGPATFIPAFNSYLAANGNFVKVVTLTDNLAASRNRFPEVNFISRQLRFPFRQIATIRVLLQVAKNADYILANGLFEESAITSWILRKKPVFKLVGDPVWERFRNEKQINLGLEEFNRSKLAIKYKIQRIILRKCFNVSSAVVTPSKQLADLAKDWGVRRDIHVIPNGVPIFPKNQDQKVLYDVITVSRLVSWKNVDKIMDACAESKLRLAVVGSGPELDYLKEYAEQNSVDVIFLGELQEESLLEAMEASTIFTIFSDYEGLSFALISAMMLGKYIVASDIPGNRNAIENGLNGILVPLEDKIAYSLELKSGMQRSERFSRICANAKRTAVDKFSDTLCYERTYSVMKLSDG